MSTNTSSLHVFQVLRVVAESDQPLGVADVVRETGLAPTTAFRALATLTEARYLSKDEHTVRYGMGQMPLILLRALFQRFPVRNLAWPTLKALAEDSGETVNLAVRIGWYGVRIASAPGTRDTLSKARVGLTQLLHRDPAMQLMLAWLPSPSMQAYRRFVRQHHAAWAADVDKAAFGKALRAAAERGWATTPAILGAGHEFAMPLRGADDEPVGVIHITGAAVQEAQPSPDARIRRWLRLRDQIEAPLRARPQDYASPYAHLDPSEILLRVNA